MNKKILSTFFLSLISSVVLAQKPYFSNGGDLIFSYAMVTDKAGNDISSNLRFSEWYNADQTMNIDFSKSLGMSLGISAHNVGMITRPNDSVRLKQRAYALGIPLSFKLGDLENRIFFSVGAETELMLDYKEKVFLDGKKTQKHHEWLSDNTELFNPSVFIRFQRKSIYFQAKYYLYDFFKPSDVIWINRTSYIPPFPQTAQMFYLSVGYSSKAKSKGKKISEPKKVNLTQSDKIMIVE
ncbi:MAG TPA: hypothetical protein DCQ93_08895 [Bacteroidetes bacterium]|nr:hypothetical protein [Bacteroidota bacterium]